MVGRKAAVCISVIIRIIGISRNGIRIMIINSPTICCSCYRNITGNIVGGIPDSGGICTVNGRII
jgi:hypothetical protein